MARDVNSTMRLIYVPTSYTVTPKDWELCFTMFPCFIFSGQLIDHEDSLQVSSIAHRQLPLLPRLNIFNLGIIGARNLSPTVHTKQNGAVKRYRRRHICRDICRRSVCVGRPTGAGPNIESPLSKLRKRSCGICPQGLGSFRTMHASIFHLCHNRRWVHDSSVTPPPPPHCLVLTLCPLKHKPTS